MSLIILTCLPDGHHYVTVDIKLDTKQLVNYIRKYWDPIIVFQLGIHRDKTFEKIRGFKKGNTNVV